MRLRKTLSIAIFAIASISPLFAADAPKDPSRQTSWGLYVDSREAYQMKTGESGAEVLFVDVRDPIEIMFTGFTDVVDVNVPYMSSNRQKWNDKKNVYAMEVNPAFEAQIAKALADRKLSKDSPVVLMCRSGGERGAPSAKMLEGKGYKQVYVVTDRSALWLIGLPAGWRWQPCCWPLHPPLQPISMPTASVVRFNTVCTNCHEGECSGRLSFHTGASGRTRSHAALPGERFPTPRWKPCS